MSPIALLAAVLLSCFPSPVVAADDSSPPAQISFDQAIKLASEVENPISRGTLLVEIAAAQTRRDNKTKARELANKGLALVRAQIDRIGDDRSGYVWVRLALLQNTLNDRDAARQSLERAIENARRIKQENLRIDLMQFIARTLAEIGAFADAQKKTELLTPRGDRTFALRDIGMAQARAGDLAGAKQTAEKMRLTSVRQRAKPISDSELLDTQNLLAQRFASQELARAEVLAEVAVAQAKHSGATRDEASKTIDLVLELVDTHESLRPELASMPLATTALAQTILGKTDQARATFAHSLRIARGLQLFPGSEIMAQVAERQWQAGSAVDARNVLREAFERFKPQASGFPQVYDLIIQTQVKIGDLDGALQTARNCRNDKGEPTLRPDVLRELVRAQAASTSPSAIVAEWYKLTRSPLYRAYILLGAAEAASTDRAPP